MRARKKKPTTPNRANTHVERWISHVKGPVCGSSVSEAWRGPTSHVLGVTASQQFGAVSIGCVLAAADFNSP